jgi:hypothetical protein
MGKRKGEQGQAMVAAAGLILLFAVVAAVAINVGWWLHDRRDAQNDVDAAALAGAHDLPDEGAASATALTWATKNNVDPADLDCCEFEDRTGDGLADLIRARVERNPGSLNSDLLDLGVVTVKTKAAAARMRAVGACVMPWGVLGDQSQAPPGGAWGLVPGQFYGFHTQDFITPGNFGALRLYGNGTPEYKDAIRTPCGTSSGGCAQGEPVPVGGTLVCETEQGNMGQNTADALNDRDSDYGAGTWCDVTTYADAVEMIETSGECAAARTVLIPIIDAWPPHGHSAPVEIFGVATFYIAGWDRKGPWGDVDMDGDTNDDMVWGYYMQDVPVIPAWNIDWGFTDDPFAPIAILLVE